MRAGRILGSLLALVLFVPPAPLPAHAVRLAPPHALRVLPRDRVPGEPSAGHLATNLPPRAATLAREIVRAEVEVASLLLPRAGKDAATSQRVASLSRVGVVSSTDLRRVATRVRDASTLLRDSTVTAGVDSALATIARGRRVAAAVFPVLPEWLDAEELALVLDAAATQHERLALAARFEEMAGLVADGVYRSSALPLPDVIPGLPAPGASAVPSSTAELEPALARLQGLRAELHTLIGLIAADVVDKLSVTAPTFRNLEPATFRAAWSSLGYRRLAALLAALEQLGDPYRFAMRGPDSFDCSGLTAFAWNGVGIALRTSSFSQREQVDRLRTAEELLPGDLVFYERTSRGRAPVGHVAMSLGVGGFIVEANQGAGEVRVAAYETGPLWGFGRVRLAGEQSDHLLMP